jgi:hypothetical protein
MGNATRYAHTVKSASEGAMTDGFEVVKDRNHGTPRQLPPTLRIGVKSELPWVDVHKHFTSPKSGAKATRTPNAPRLPTVSKLR